MIMNIERELIKLSLLAKYASDYVQKIGLDELKASNSALGVIKIKQINIAADDFLGKGPCVDSSGGHTAIYKELYGSIHYITLVDFRHYNSDYLYYLKRIQFCDDPAVVEIKKELRQMIKNPSRFYTIT